MPIHFLGGGGNASGPAAASSTDNAVARWDGTTGRLLQNSVVTVGDTGATAGITTLSCVDVDAGASGTAGTVDIFPTTAAKGKLAFAAADSAGNTTTSITNASQAGARTYTIPDAGASASFVMTEGAQTINGVKTFGGACVFSDLLTINKDFGQNASIFTCQDASSNVFEVINNTAGVRTVWYQAGTFVGELNADGGTPGFNFITGTNIPIIMTPAGTGEIQLKGEIVVNKAIQAATLSSNAFTASSARCDITAESAGVDQLDTVSGLVDGQIVWLKGATGQTITVAEAGNIKVAGATIVLSTVLWTEFMYDGTQSKLIQISALLTD